MGTQNRRFESIRNISEYENKRQKLQKELDIEKGIEYRRMQGQFSTPIQLSKEIVEYGLSLVDRKEIVFLEPAMGTGAFVSSFLEKTIENRRNVQIIGVEKDSDFFDAARSIWKSSCINIINTDFLLAEPIVQADLIITNPPYVRHHYLEKGYKKTIREVTKKNTSMELSGLAGLYCYFIMNVHRWMKPGAVCGLLVPSEFMDVKYGDVVKDFLLNQVHLIRIHRYDPEHSKFEDAMVSSCVVWFKNEAIETDYEIKYSYNGTLENPKIKQVFKRSYLREERKWTQVFRKFPKHENKGYSKLGDYFDIKRGLATGDNSFFIMTKDKIRELQLDNSMFKAILPSPRYLKVDEVGCDKDGYPNLDEQYFLLDCKLDEGEIQKKYPDLWLYLEEGAKSTAEKYLCKSRKKWYFQEQREATPFLCSYMGRGNNGVPFRFILNHSEAIATNSYLMLYPKPELSKLLELHEEYIDLIWRALQSINTQDIECEGRVYGGGLKKIEPKELGNVKFNLQF